MISTLVRAPIISTPAPRMVGWRVPICTGMLSLLISASALLGAEDDSVFDPVPSKPRETSAPDHWQLRVDRAIIAKVFGGRFHDGSGSFRGPRDYFVAQQTVRIQELDAACELTQAQRARLQLAALGDRERFFQRIDCFREQYGQDPSFTEDAAKNQEFRSQLTHLQLRSQRLLTLSEDGLSSQTMAGLLERTIPEVLTAEQTERWKKAELQRREYAWQAWVERTIMRIEEICPMKAARRDALRQRIITVSERLFPEPPALRAGRPPPQFLHALDTEILPECFDAADCALLKKAFASSLPLVK